MNQQKPGCNFSLVFMLEFTRSFSIADLEGILSLQKENHFSNLSDEEKEKEGFVTVVHKMEDLKKLNDLEPHIIAKENEKVVGYLLAMVREARYSVPALVPMFEEFEKIRYHNKPFSDFPFIVVGQVCLHKDFRGKGLLKELYQYYREALKDKYDFAVTEINTKNQRSIKAHLKSGFREIHHYFSPNNSEWSIVLWDWKEDI